MLEEIEHRHLRVGDLHIKNMEDSQLVEERGPEIEIVRDRRMLVFYLIIALLEGGVNIVILASCKVGGKGCDTHVQYFVGQCAREDIGQDGSDGFFDILRNTASSGLEKDMLSYAGRIIQIFILNKRRHLNEIRQGGFHILDLSAELTNGLVVETNSPFESIRRPSHRKARFAHLHKIPLM